MPGTRLEPPWEPESGVHLSAPQYKRNERQLVSQKKCDSVPKTDRVWLLFVAEPPGALCTYLVVSFA